MQLFSLVPNQNLQVLFYLDHSWLFKPELKLKIKQDLGLFILLHDICVLILMCENITNPIGFGSICINKIVFYWNFVAIMALNS